MADTVDQALADAERDVADEVRAVLDELADDIAAGLADATEIVAARWSLSRIAGMWSAKVPRIMRRLFRVAETAGEQAANDVDATLPDTWDGLPGRYDRGDLPASLGDYATSTEHLLRAVGDRLTEAAVAALAEGLDAGEDTAQLRARLRALFAADGAQLGESREELIARTEAVRAWNGATLAAAQDLTGADRPLVKQWRTRGDTRVRDSHRKVDGFVRLLDDPFTVGGVDMQYPGDPAAPADQVCNCRCVLRLQRAEASASAGSQAGLGDESSNQGQATAAADGSHLMGGMIALIPTREDAERLALDGGEAADELHCTLMFLGDQGGDWTTDQRNELIAGIRARFAALPGPIDARLFGVNHWNPGENGVWVWATGDDSPAYPALPDARALAVEALEDTHERPEVPEQHSPWVAHVTGAYDAGTWPLDPMCERLGPVRFDRVRVAFGGEHTDIPLGPEEEPMPDTSAAAYEPPVRTWSTPDGTALAYENQETGDGRVFAAGSLYWDGAGPWPLQYADEMGMGHDGAELAGAIQAMNRNGDRLTGNGVLYLTQQAGWEASTLLDQKAPLGVSVDLDDVSVELVDNTAPADGQPADGGDGGDGAPVLASATYARASVLRLGDDGWVITASSAIETTASAAALTRAVQTVQVISGPGGRIPADTARALFPGALTAAAGDADNPDGGVVVHAENAGDYLVRITRARVRGATLVAMPAYDKARIVIDPEQVPEGEPTQAPAEDVAAAAGSDLTRVVAHVCGAPTPVSARDVAAALGLTLSTTKRHLRAAVRDERIVRLGRGLYAAPSTIPEGDVSAAATDDQATGEQPTGHNSDDGDHGHGHGMTELEASAWTAMRAAPPMPAAWFREPTEEELPPGSGGVHFADGRIWGWVAQAGVPHATHGRKVTIEKLAANDGLDLSHFLRARFTLDDGSEVRAGAFTMNVGHHRDGYECETAACQFDDSRTVAGIVTVGMSEGGLWFSGAASPWLGEWDLNVFRSCQPSYHMTQGPDGRWQLRAVLSVPVPGHSSPLLASAVVERSNLALTAAAALADVAEPAAPVDEPEPEHARADDASPVVEQLTAAFLTPTFLDTFAAALEERQQQRAEVRAEVEALAALVEPGAAITASAAPQQEGR